MFHIKCELLQSCVFLPFFIVLTAMQFSMLKIPRVMDEWVVNRQKTFTINISYGSLIYHVDIRT